MNFKLTWLVVLLLSLLGGVFASSCPPTYSKLQNKCVKDRPIRGSCDPGATWQVSINKCVRD